MSYLAELHKEFFHLRKETLPHLLRKKSKAQRLAKLRRYIGRVRGEHVPNQKWLTGLFQGRLCRTPFRFKFEKY